MEGQDVPLESKHLAELQQQKEDLLGKVQKLKQELHDWRTNLDSQIKAYRNEVGEIRKTLNAEIEVLRNDFQDLRTNLKQQLEIAAGLAAQDVSATMPLSTTDASKNTE